MRRLLVDRARRRKGRARQVTLDEGIIISEERSAEQVMRGGLVVYSGALGHPVRRRCSALRGAGRCDGGELSGYHRGAAPSSRGGDPRRAPAMAGGGGRALAATARRAGERH